jgi:hypothetical protein
MMGKIRMVGSADGLTIFDETGKTLVQDVEGNSGVFALLEHLGIEYDYNYLNWYQKQIPDNIEKWEDVPREVREYCEL